MRMTTGAPASPDAFCALETCLSPQNDRWFRTNFRKMREEYLDTYFIAELPPEGLPAEFGVITAFNPDGLPASQNYNLQADLRLEHRLGELGLRHFRVIGSSRDARHQEPGFGVVTHDRGVLESLCRQFVQEAYFWIENGEIYCIEIGTGETRHVSRWLERQMMIC
jgi:hypothetical protein